MKSKRNSVESEVKHKSISNGKIETTVSNANYDIREREQKIKELVQISGKYEREIKELEEQFGMYEQEIYEINLLLQQLRDNTPLYREIISYNGNMGQMESVKL